MNSSIIVPVLANASWELSPLYCFSQYSILLTWKHLIVILFSCILHLEKKQSGAVVMWQVSKGGGRSPHSREGEPSAQILLKPLWPVSSSAMGFQLVEVDHWVPLLPNSLACKIAVPWPSGVLWRYSWWINHIPGSPASNCCRVALTANAFITSWEQRKTESKWPRHDPFYG